MSFDLFAYRDLQDTVADCEDKYDLIERAVLDPSVMERFRERTVRRIYFPTGPFYVGAGRRPSGF